MSKTASSWLLESKSDECASSGDQHNNPLAISLFVLCHLPPYLLWVISTSLIRGQIGEGGCRQYRTSRVSAKSTTRRPRHIYLVWISFDLKPPPSLSCPYVSFHIEKPRTHLHHVSPFVPILRRPSIILAHFRHSPLDRSRRSSSSMAPGSLWSIHSCR